jgi:hypothetical protein
VASGVAWIVATVRNDLWHRATEIPQLVELVEAGARLDLAAPGGAEIIEIVRRPAAAAARSVGSGGIKEPRSWRGRHRAAGEKGAAKEERRRRNAAEGAAAGDGGNARRRSSALESSSLMMRVF